MEQAKKLLSDQELLDRCKNGDRESRETLARACIARVRKTVILVIGNKQDVDDITQTALMRIFRGLKGFRKEASLTTWVDRVTVNTAREFMRRKPFLKLFYLDSNSVELIPQQAQTTPQSQLENKIAIKYLTEALSLIKPKKRIALVLSAAYGYTASEIADLTGCSVETAKKRLQHGRKELLTRARNRNHLRQLLEENI